jgi:hypothetical protein
MTVYIKYSSSFPASIVDTMWLLLVSEIGESMMCVTLVQGDWVVVCLQISLIPSNSDFGHYKLQMYSNKMEEF